MLVEHAGGRVQQTAVYTGLKLRREVWAADILHLKTDVSCMETFQHKEMSTCKCDHVIM